MGRASRGWIRGRGILRSSVDKGWAMRRRSLVEIFRSTPGLFSLLLSPRSSLPFPGFLNIFFHHQQTQPRCERAASSFHQISTTTKFLHQVVSQKAPYSASTFLSVSLQVPLSVCLAMILFTCYPPILFVYMHPSSSALVSRLVYLCITSYIIVSYSVRLPVLRRLHPSSIRPASTSFVFFLHRVPSTATCTGGPIS